MKAYVYKAALLCEWCGRKQQEEIEFLNMRNGGNHRSWEDSNAYPQGPYSEGGGEADSPQHCDDCSKFLENPLTVDGFIYAQDQLDRNTYNPVVLRWADYYRLSPS